MLLCRCTLALSCLCVFTLGCGGGSKPTPSSPSQPAPNAVPAVMAVTPAAELAGSGDVTITVTGTGFVQGSSVEWNGGALTTAFVSGQTLTATLPAADLAGAGAGKVSVLTPSPGGGVSNAVAFTVNNPVPAIAAVAPATLVAGSGPITLDVKGSGFVSTSQANWNGQALTTTIVSTSELTAVLPAALVSGSSASSVTVSNPGPGGGAAPAAPVTVSSPTPMVTGIAPAVLPTGVAATVSVTGAGFEANSVVLWNGAARPTTVVSATTLQVLLTVADLQAVGTGTISVSNPGPGSGVSGGATLTVSSRPTITGVLIQNPRGTQSLPCPQLSFYIQGANFATGATVQVNGIDVTQTNEIHDTENVFGTLPVAFRSSPGALSFTVTNPGQTPLTSDPFPYPAGPPIASLCMTPQTPTVYPASASTIRAKVSIINAAGNEQLLISALPSGVTTPTPSVAIGTGSADLHVQTASSAIAGTYTAKVSVVSGGTTFAQDLPLTVSGSAVPNFFFSQPFYREVGVPIGGSGSIQIITNINASGGSVFDITPAISGLPARTTASFSPAVFSPGDTVTVTLTAAGDAPVAQNVPVTLTGTASAQVTAASVDFLADVTAPPGSLPNNRTDFVSLAGTPYGGIYDAGHNVIFASNPGWNRVDVISNVTHQVLKHIPIRAPRGLDMTPDGGRVWVETASRLLYAIDTNTLQTQTYSLPNSTFGPSGADVHNFSGTNRIFALSDGTLFLYFDDFGGEGSAQVGVFNPQTNQLRVLSGPGTIDAWSLPLRSGDGTRVYAANELYAQGIELYDVASQTLTTLNPSIGYQPILAVNRDGSRLVLAEGQGAALYDNSLNRLGALPGSVSGFGITDRLGGGVIFSPDGSKLYMVGTYSGVNAALTVDASSLSLLGVAPAMLVNPVWVSGAGGLTVPFGIDGQGLVLGVQYYGVAWEDAAFFQTYAANQPGAAIQYAQVFAGPLGGGPPFTPSLNGALTPDAWFGQTRGTVTNDGVTFTFSAPPSATPGPVNLKLLFPDGVEQFLPQFYAYSTDPEYALLSGSSPNGGAPGSVLGYGLPQDVSGGTVTVGGNQATVTTMAGQYPPFGGQPVPSTVLNFNFPQGAPGRADLTVTSPIGSGTLPRAVLYAREVTDYASADSFSAVLLDKQRNQLYLSAGDHIDVFSLASRQFVAQLHPAARGSATGFTGLALTPDGSLLLAANLLDGSLGVINPDVPSSTFAIPIVSPLSSCAGPLHVAAAANQRAFVVTGVESPNGCSTGGAIYLVDLQTRTAAQPNGSCTGLSAESTSDGLVVALGKGPTQNTCLYSAVSNTYSSIDAPLPAGFLGVTISGDGNVIGEDRGLSDASGRLVGLVSQPAPFYGYPDLYAGITQPVPLLHPKLNASGSLYFFAYPNYFEIVDVPTGVLRLRFSLTETVQATASPMAIDPGGRMVFLLTDKGLTLVDLGAAPLGVGHLSASTAAAGSQITVRGSGFDATVNVKVGNTATVVNVTDENTLVMTVPPVSSGPHDLVLTRGDGESYTLASGMSVP